MKNDNIYNFWLKLVIACMYRTTLAV